MLFFRPISPFPESSGRLSQYGFNNVARDVPLVSGGSQCASAAIRALERMASFPITVLSEVCTSTLADDLANNSALFVTESVTRVSIL